jgi:hypothetical protein
MHTTLPMLSPVKVVSVLLEQLLFELQLFLFQLQLFLFQLGLFNDPVSNAPVPVIRYVYVYVGICLKNYWLVPTYEKCGCKY